ncbi:RDD family protein [Thermodesulfobacteriota bacterium]
MTEDKLFDYSKNTLDELQQVYRDINREKYPERFQKVVKEIEKRKTQGEGDQIEKKIRTYKPFIRRFGSFFIDTLLIGIIGQLISAGFMEELMALGNKGPFIGLVILILYFGIGNSALFNGQTIGKFLLGIQVVNLKGEKISVQKSILRSLIYIVPYIFNGWGLDLGKGALAVIFWSIIGAWLFSFTVALILFFVGNWKVGRLFHDVLFSTKVLLIGNDIAPNLKTEKVLSILSLTALLVLFIVFSFKSFCSERPASLTPIGTFYEQIQKTFPDLRFRVNLTHVNTNEQINVLAVRAFPFKPLSENQLAHQANAIAKETIIAFDDINAIDFLSISIVQGFNIGIASRSKSSSERWAIGKWREKLNLEGDFEQGKDKKIPFMPSLFK